MRTQIRLSLSMLSLTAMVLAACGGSSSPPPTASPPPVALTETIDPHIAFADTSTVVPGRSGFYVLDVETGALRGVAAAPGVPLRFPAWDPAGDALVFVVEDVTYRLDMKNDVRSMTAPTPAPTRESYQSADGKWQIAMRTGGVDVLPAGPLAEGRNHAYGLYEWSPVGHLLASWGGPCGGGLTILDAATSATLPTPIETSTGAVGISWMPDGSGLVVAVRGEDAGLVLVRLNDAAAPRRLLSLGMIPTTALPIPRGFSASGRYLLLLQQGGYDCSN